MRLINVTHPAHRGDAASIAPLNAIAQSRVTADAIAGMTGSGCQRRFVGREIAKFFNFLSINDLQSRLAMMRDRPED
jgi:hypothetical protein